MNSHEPEATRLERATAYVHDYSIPKGERPVYHLTPPTGWMNDPNGFSFFDGKVHLFYQFHPYSDAWGPMHWGHATTEDFLSWQDLPVALAPDMLYDCDGCFSGTAVTRDGCQVLFYTGNARIKTPDGARAMVQQQCMAEGDGMHYVKSPANPVISADQLPAGYLAADFRDPKVWKEDGRYLLIAGARAADGLGHILLYESENLTDWRFASVLAANDGRFGDMWECPDLFSLGGSDVLLASPMHVKDAGPHFHDGYGTLAMIGSLNRERMAMEPRTVVPVDYGHDFYAPQTTLLPDGRRVMVAWMQAWENFIKPKTQKWHGMMTFPRELHVEGDRLVQQPVRELEAAYTDSVEHYGVTITGEAELSGIRGRVLDLEIDLLSLEGPQFVVELARRDRKYVSFTWNQERRIMTFDRGAVGDYYETRHDASAVQSFPVTADGPELHLRFLLDTCSVELFVSGGKQTFTSTFYVPLEADGIAFRADGRAVMNVRKHTIKVPETA